MRGGDKLDSSLGNRARRVGVEFDADLVNDYDFRHVILDRLDHHVMLEGGRRHLHPSCTAYRGVGNVAVTGYLVRRVHNDDATMSVVRQNSCHLAQHSSLADSGLSEQQNALARHYQVFDDTNSPIHRPTDAQRKPDCLSAAISDRGNAMQSAFDTGPVILAEPAYTRDGMLNVVFGYFRRTQRHTLLSKPRLRLSSQVQNDLQKLVEIISAVKRFLNVGWELVYQDSQVQIYFSLQICKLTHAAGEEPFNV